MTCPPTVYSIGHNESEWNGKVENKEEMVFAAGIIKSLLSLLRSRLTRETWKKQPNAKHALVWTLKQLKVCLPSRINSCPPPCTSPPCLPPLLPHLFLPPLPHPFSPSPSSCPSSTLTYLLNSPPSFLPCLCCWMIMK